MTARAVIESVAITAAVLVLAGLLTWSLVRNLERPQVPPLEEDRVAMRLGLVPLGLDLAYYGTRVVHRQCLTARRDGRSACADCARVMVGAA